MWQCRHCEWPLLLLLWSAAHETQKGCSQASGSDKGVLGLQEADEWPVEVCAAAKDCMQHVGPLLAKKPAGTSAYLQALPLARQSRSETCEKQHQQQREQQQRLEKIAVGLFAAGTFFPGWLRLLGPLD
eukprot:symbB.v1.2.008104.t1/scaffold456.1/size203390/7